MRPLNSCSLLPSRSQRRPALPPSATLQQNASAGFRKCLYSPVPAEPLPDLQSSARRSGRSAAQVFSFLPLMFFVCLWCPKSCPRRGPEKVHARKQGKQASKPMAPAHHDHKPSSTLVRKDAKAQKHLRTETLIRQAPKQASKEARKQASKCTSTLAAEHPEPLIRQAPKRSKQASKQKSNTPNTLTRKAAEAPAPNP